MLRKFFSSIYDLAVAVRRICPMAITPAPWPPGPTGPAHNIPIKFVCLGEKVTDIEYFDLEKYIYGLFAEMIDEE